MKDLYIRLVSNNKIYPYPNTDSQGRKISFQKNQPVLVENDQIIEEGRIIEKPKDIELEDNKGVIVRTFEENDYLEVKRLKKMAGEYIEEAQKKILRHNLKMKILDADLSFDQKKLTFYFSANGRVDFRGLVLDLAKSFEKLIRLQQVSSREETKHFGGLGKCGREYCCSKFISNCDEINCQLAKKSNLANFNTSKLLGRCGKPMCCLLFEEEASGAKVLTKERK